MAEHRTCPACETPGATGLMRILLRRNRGLVRAPAEQLLEVVTPRTNAALISPAENMCGALTLHTGAPGGGPVALEIVADGERSRFFVRTDTSIQQRQLRGQIGAAYPQAALRSLEPVMPQPSGWSRLYSSHSNWRVTCLPRVRSWCTSSQSGCGRPDRYSSSPRLKSRASRASPSRSSGSGQLRPAPWARVR